MGVCWVLIDGVGDIGRGGGSGAGGEGGEEEEESVKRSLLDIAQMDACCSVASSGISGLMDPVQAGLACGSDTAHLSMFGYDPRKYYRGRGAFETMGAGLDMQPGDIAFKCNFAYLGKDGIVESRRADRNFENVGPILCDFLNGIAIPSFPQHSVAVKYATEHRCGLRVRGPSLSDNITGTDPLKDKLPLRRSCPLDSSEEAELTAKLVNSLSQAITEALQDHQINKDRVEQGKLPANAVLLRGCGARVKVPTFEEKHGMRSFMIAPTCLIRGLGMSLEMDIVDAPGATGDYHTDLQSKARTALATFKKKTPEYELGFVHVKAVDDAGHDKSAELKLKFLKKVDNMIGELAKGLAEIEQETGKPFVICVTGDHSTPVAYGDHSAEPVPFSIAPVKVSHAVLLLSHYHHCFLSDSVMRFDEVSCAQGWLGRFQGLQVMGIIQRFRQSLERVRRGGEEVKRKKTAEPR
ncbi:hypothetical protein GUITHDRAFT_157400 [Guillardia theta CCMP2712]|uniref:Metalloenzyme domain-containing protein n=1 Tax=Guillardia theta (strain CCMP2712) TaxID=905079 RepID=L1JMC6_GUITC|nr:hypothetical protein GUITHDRAFT_157400 [Guillardia theta CCMP2712]EKX49751.1 hypothetical protein GUITHDRAFT_157400 [Guillardia theta CCMP2712]|eukprot:XP_005836731.1 hypothetical protein GUITHDRAFT_157400 [Guillardia theta CCMP2712]